MQTEWTDRDVNKFLDEKLGLDRLVFWPDRRLNQKCKEVTVFDSELEKLVSEMKQTMGSADGIGIAAPQIGVLKQVICISVPKDGQFHELANPVCAPFHDSKKIFSQEGCLSFPSVYVKVERWDKITLTGNDIKDGHLVSIYLEGLPAIVAQHETDHVSGITMVDHLSKLKRDIIRAKILKDDRLKGRF